MNANSCLALLGIALLPSCALVTTSAPLGETPATIAEKDWNGIWTPEPDENDRGDDNIGVIFAKVTSPEKGELKILSVDPENLETQTNRLPVRQIGPLLVGNLLDPDSKHWLPFLIERLNDDRIAIRLFSAPGTRKILGLKDPEKPNDSLDLSEESTKKFAEWLAKLPADKGKRDKALEQLTEEKEDRMIFVRLHSPK